MRVGGLFSGIGGWELGLERAGMRVLWHCESDPFCQRVLEHHWPGVPVYPDVRRLTERGAGRYNIAPVDVLCGGFPCQDISSAGAGAGIDGERSGLWSEYARLVGELRPRYVLVENVSALLARGLGRVLSDLSALGYDAEWDCIPASAVGAPHRRDRVWVVAYPAGDDGGSRGSGGSASGGARQSESERALQVADTQVARLEGTGLRGRSVDSRADVAHAASAGSPDRDAGALQGRAVAGWPPIEPERRGGALGDADGASEDAHAAAGGPWGAARESSGWSVEPDVGRVADGVPARVDRLRSLGNALVPDIAEWIGRRVLAYEQACNE